ncbi:MAG: TetR/AcrR family transcriptional regulator [Vicinamibacterales bacterium]
MNSASSADSRVSLRSRFRTATREAILQAAAELLGADDGAQTRMEDIAARAGIAVGTLYNYFEDRKALVSTLLESRTRSLLDELDAVVSRRKPSAAAGDAADTFRLELTDFVDALGSHLESNRFLFGVLHDEERQRGIDAQAATRKSTVVGELLTRAERLMEKGIRTKVLRKSDPALYAALFIGMLRGIALTAFLTPGAAPKWGTDAIVRQFLTGAAR